MKHIFWLLIFFLPLNSLASTWQAEIEQTQSFMSSMMVLFSTQALLSLFFAIITIVGTFMLAKVLQWRIFHLLERSNIGDESSKEEIIGVVSRTINIFIYVAGFSIALWVLGVDLWIFMWGIGFGIGFTLRTFLTNFISGIIIVTQWSYHIWDMIEVGDKQGYIIKIQALFTSIQELDGVMFNIPNVRFFEENVRNFHTNDKRRIDIEVEVQHGTDIMQARKILEKVASNFPVILQAPTSDVLVEYLWDNGIRLKLRFWIHSRENFLTLKSHMVETINHAFAQNNIHIAAPRMISDSSMSPNPKLLKNTQKAKTQ